MRKVSRPEVRVEREDRPERRRSVKLLMDLRPEAQKRSPGPSKAVYRLTRTWKKTWVRRAALVILPAMLLGLAGWRVATNPAVHAFVAEQRQAVIAALAERPEFAVRGYAITGASAALHERLSLQIDVPPGASTLTFDVAALREEIASVKAVRNSSVKLDAKGILQIRVDERVPAALVRDGDDRLWLADGEGVIIDPAEMRSDWPGLPLVIGEGGGEEMIEALSLFRAVPELKPRIRALVRVGERRWNLALDRGLTILLPEDAPREALTRVMAWHYGDDVLDRGLTAVDMRLPDRPTLRMNPKAQEILRLRDVVAGEGEET